MSYTGLVERNRAEAAMLREIAGSQARGLDWATNLKCAAEQFDIAADAIEALTRPVDVEAVDPFAWADGVAWHKPAHRSVMASVRLGAWMSAALDDPAVCDAMKADIREWFSAGEPMEILCAALAAMEATHAD